MDIARLAIEVDSRSAKGAATDLDRMTAAGRRAEGQFNTVEKASMSMNASLVRLSAAAAGVFSVRELAGYADAWTEIQNRLRLVTAGQTELAMATRAVVDISKATNQELSATTQVYQRFAQQADALGISLAEVGALTDTVSKAVAISGASAGAAEAALTQFGQALASGVLRGEEFNSVMEQTPGLAMAIADGLGVAVGELRAMAADGEITANRLVEALQRAQGSVDQQFSTRVVTISQAFTNLNTELTKYIGEASQSSGTSRLLAASIQAVADNLDALTTGAVVFGIGRVTQALIGKSRAVASSVSAMSAQVVASEQAARAQVAETAAAVARNRATQEAIILSRADLAAKLQQVNAEIASANATIQATTANGAHSQSIALKRAATEALTAAELRRVAIVTELATLGMQQARVSSATTAALTAQTAAQTALGAATSATAGAARLAAGLIGALGGPLGAVTLALTAGVTAWQVWGRESEESANQAQGAISRTTGEILKDLDRQIAKLKERNAAARLGATVGVEDTDVQARMLQLRQQMDDIQSARGNWANMTPEGRQMALVETAKQYGLIFQKAQQLNEAQEEFNKKSRDELTLEWLGKYATEGERLKKELQEASKAFGGVVPPEVEARIRERYAKKPTTKKTERNYAADSIDELLIRIGELDEPINGMAVKFEAATDKMSEFSVQAARNIQNSLGDGLYSILKGNFDDIGQAFGDTVMRMAADAAAANLAGALFGDYGSTGKVGGLIGNTIAGFRMGLGGPVSDGGVNLVSTMGTGAGATWGPMLQLYDGGYTGAGGKFEPAGVVHRGEYVFDQESTGRLGVPFLESLRRGYAGGGVVHAPAQASQPSIELNVINQSSQPVQAKPGAMSFDGKRWVQQVILSDLRTNGPIARSMKGVMA